MTLSSLYTKDFFELHQTGMNLSARALVPIVFELTHPTSVIDVGCGTGAFLRVFHEYGVHEILGIDGDYVDRRQLAIPQERFQAIDLSLPFSLERTYDLAICLEVAEHLAPACAHDFIASLTRVAPVILFSAAIPFQYGVHHVNEQWPDYWVQLFREQGFFPVDALRKRIWNDSQIEVWYRQNSMFFCTEHALATNDVLAREFNATNPDMLSIVHPETYKQMHEWALRYNTRPMNIGKSLVKMLLRK